MGLAVESGVEKLGWTPAPSVIDSFFSYEENSLWRRRKLKAAEGLDSVGVSDGNERIIRFPDGNRTLLRCPANKGRIAAI